MKLAAQKWLHSGNKGQKPKQQPSAYPSSIELWSKNASEGGSDSEKAV